MGSLSFAHGGNIYEIKSRYKKKVIDFSANINPFGIPQKVKKAVRKNIDLLQHYPDPEGESLKEAIACYWNIKRENILVGNGSVELIYLLLRSLLPQTVCLPVPSFADYERASRCVKAKINFIRLKAERQFRFDFSGLDRSDVLLIANPNNPTGNILIENRNILEKLPFEFIIIDEAFMDFVPEEKELSLLRKAVKSRRFIVLRTFTKFFALPGLRIGYLVAHRDVIKHLKKFQVPWSSNVLAQTAAEEILKDKNYIQASRQYVEKERQFLFNNLNSLPGLKIFPSSANFFLAKITKAGVCSSLLRKRLIQKGILIRDCSNFRGLNEKFIRLAVRTRGENHCLLKALKETL